MKWPVAKHCSVNNYTASCKPHEVYGHAAREGLPVYPFCRPQKPVTLKISWGTKKYFIGLRGQVAPQPEDIIEVIWPT